MKINSQYLIENSYIYIFYKVNGYVSSLYRIIYEINHEKLVDIMEKAHSPMAMKLLLDMMILNCEVDFQIYNRLIMSNMEWLRECAYYYFNTIIINKIKSGDCVDYKACESIPDDIAIYQYAACIERISFELDRIRRNSSCDIEYLSNLDEIFSSFVEKEINLMNKETNFDENKLFKLLNGSNDRINYKNYFLLIHNLNNEECKNIFLRVMIKLFQEKWESDEYFFADNDYNITYYTAYACLEYWDNDVETILRNLKINKKSLHSAIESGKYDMNFDEWNKSVQKVLWQLLFLKNYKKLLVENGINKGENYDRILKKITELSVIKNDIVNITLHFLLVNFKSKQLDLKKHNIAVF